MEPLLLPGVLWTSQEYASVHLALDFFHHQESTTIQDKINSHQLVQRLIPLSYPTTVLDHQQTYLVIILLSH